MLKISLPKVLLCSFHQCVKFQNMELCTVVFCMFHAKYQCISLESFLPIYQTMIHYKQSKACLVFSYFHQFLELVEEDANPWALQLCLVCHFVHCDIEPVVFSVNNSQTLLQSSNLPCIPYIPGDLTFYNHTWNLVYVHSEEAYLEDV